MGSLAAIPWITFSKPRQNCTASPSTRSFVYRSNTHARPALRIASGALSGIINPVTSASTASLDPVDSVLITASPHAAASSATLGNPSWSVGSTNKSIARQYGAVSAPYPVYRILLCPAMCLRQEDIPVVICSGKNVLRNPKNQKLAECLGFTGRIDEHRIYDVAIVGAGPAGLAATVYAASEGFGAQLIQSEYPGGQAGASSKIENCVSFPMGISGQELAGRSVVQAEKFGAQMLVGQKVVKIRCDQRPYQLTLENGAVIETRSIVIATGAQYNKPNIENLGQFEGQGIYSAATAMEAQLCPGAEIIVVGGANSAGQAAVFPAQTVHKVHMLVRGKELSETM
jgi:hypothetical protein